MRRSILCLAALTAVFAGTLTVSQPAAAAALNVNVLCNPSNALASTPSTTLVATTGDTITVNNGSSARLDVTLTGATGVAFWSLGATTFNVTATTGSIQLTSAGGLCTGTSVTISFSASGGGGGGGGGTTTSSDAPAPVVQQFGLPTAGTCDAAASKDLNWAGVASGGWATSWGQWMNVGKGGAVCTRTLFYNTRIAAWAVQA